MNRGIEMFKDRIKHIRKELKLTQEEFSKQVGLSRGAYAKYEYGDVQPTDLIFKVVSSEFKVNEQWLRTGEGEMFTSSKGLYADIVTDAMEQGNERIRDLIIEANELNDEELEAFINFLKTINANKKK